MKPPKWHRDEVILALDLYFSLEPKEMTNKNPKVIELSEILNCLPIHEERGIHQKFRNPNGIGMKMANFKAIDPDFAGKGMEKYSKLEEEVFYEFRNQKEQLKEIALQIRKIVSNDELNNKLYQIPDEKEDGVETVKEGRVIYKLHKLRERKPEINKAKKDKYFKEYGKLDCEVCRFDFFEFYGELGKGYMEAHHRIPLSQLKSEMKTKLADLALVCSNCHRMLHRKIDTMTIDDLRKRIS